MTDSRRKGKVRENELAQALRGVFPNARRNLDQTRESTGRDFDGTAPLCVQLKSGRSPSWRKALEEAQGSAQLGEAAIGVTRADRGPFVVHIGLEDFLHLIDRGHAQADHEFDDRQERLLDAMADHGRNRR